MSNLKQLRGRVRSIKSTQKITKAMQLVSAAKLKKVKDKVESLSEFSDVLDHLMSAAAMPDNLGNLSETDKRFFEANENLPKLFIIFSSERGLCGAFNASVLRKVKYDIDQTIQAGGKAKLLVVGKKGYDGLKSKYSDMILAHYFMSKDNLETIVQHIKNQIISMTRKREIGSCVLYFNKFKNAMTQVVTLSQIIPIIDHRESKANEVSEGGYEYEGEGLFNNIINLYCSGQVNYALLQSKASEEGARMTAMDNATRNAGELIQKLTLKLNRSRQAIITTELTEIISGAEAL
jgi:F-type H+-transporting ATPase subunit gamma